MNTMFGLESDMVASLPQPPGPPDRPSRRAEQTKRADIMLSAGVP